MRGSPRCCARGAHVARADVPGRPPRGAAPRGGALPRWSLLRAFGDEPRAGPRHVLNFPAEAVDLSAEAIGLGEIPRGSRGVACLCELADVRGRLGAITLNAEAEHGEAAREEIELAGGAPVVEDREGARRVEVVLEGFCELAPGARARARGGDAERGAESLGLGARRLHGRVSVLDRVPILRPEEEHEHRVAAPRLE